MHPQAPEPWKYPLPPPRFDIRKLFSRFEAPIAAKAERDRRVTSLLRRGTAEHERLAHQLSACSPSGRCGLSACPVCYRRFRRLMIGSTLRIFRAERTLIMSTLIPPSWAVPTDRLQEFSPLRGVAAFRQQLRRVGAGDFVVIGGIDGDYDVASCVWRPHLHLVAAANLAPKLQRLSERFYSSPDGAYRPSFTRAVADGPAQISYCFKSYWNEKVRYVGRDGQERNSACRLREPVHADWLVWRAGYSFTDFVFAQGVRRRAGFYEPINPAERE